MIVNLFAQGLEMLTGVSLFLQGHVFLNVLLSPFHACEDTVQAAREMKKRVSWQLEAAILDWVKA